MGGFSQREEDNKKYEREREFRQGIVGDWPADIDFLVGVEGAEVGAVHSVKHEMAQVPERKCRRDVREKIPENCGNQNPERDSMKYIPLIFPRIARVGDCGEDFFRMPYNAAFEVRNEMVNVNQSRAGERGGIITRQFADEKSGGEVGREEHC